MCPTTNSDEKCIKEIILNKVQATASTQEFIYYNFFFYSNTIQCYTILCITSYFSDSISFLRFNKTRESRITRDMFVPLRVWQTNYLDMGRYQLLYFTIHIFEVLLIWTPHVR